MAARNAIAAKLPHKHSTLRLGGKDTHASPSFYDAKFYPYVEPGAAAVFAVAGAGGIFVCNIPSMPGETVEVLHSFDDDESEATTGRPLPPVTLTWAQDVDAQTPLLCVSGESPKIKIIDALSGKLVRTLTGHGMMVNDLQTSPLNPAIIASACMDTDLRIWNLDRSVESRPCAAILGGAGGHAEGILTIDFHHTGRYIISAGMDTAIKLWVLPDFPDENSGSDKITQIHYPHFSTDEVHTDFIDCVRFYNDLIISRAAKENTIQIWKIDQFNSVLPAPPSTSAPVPSTTNSTISAFGGRFQRLLTFDTPSCSLFYMRFGFFHQPQKHPILVMGNEKSKFYMWDLQLLGESGQGSYAASAADAQGFKKPAPKPQKKGQARSSLVVEQRSGSFSGSSTGGKLSSTPIGTPASAREESIASNESGGVSGPAVPEKKSVTRDPFKPIAAHKTFTVGKVNFASRAIGWSPGGEWCVAAGDNGMICLFRRWDKA